MIRTLLGAVLLMLPQLLFGQDSSNRSVQDPYSVRGKVLHVDDPHSGSLSKKEGGDTVYIEGCEIKRIRNGDLVAKTISTKNGAYEVNLPFAMAMEGEVHLIVDCPGYISNERRLVITTMMLSSSVLYEGLRVHFVMSKTFKVFFQKNGVEYLDHELLYEAGDPKELHNSNSVLDHFLGVWDEVQERDDPEGLKIVLTGHAGPQEKNKDSLARERAMKVKEYLLEQGVEERRIRLRNKRDTEPIQDQEGISELIDEKGQTGEGLNRRVSFWIK